MMRNTNRSYSTAKIGELSLNMLIEERNERISPKSRLEQVPDSSSQGNKGMCSRDDKHFLVPTDVVEIDCRRNLDELQNRGPIDVTDLPPPV